MYWQTQNRKTLKKINILIKDINRNPFDIEESASILDVFLPFSVDDNMYSNGKTVYRRYIEIYRDCLEYLKRADSLL